MRLDDSAMDADEFHGSADRRLWLDCLPEAPEDDFDADDGDDLAAFAAFEARVGEDA